MDLPTAVYPVYVCMWGRWSRRVSDHVSVTTCILVLPCSHTLRYKGPPETFLLLFFFLRLHEMSCNGILFVFFFCTIKRRLVIDFV